MYHEINNEIGRCVALYIHKTLHTTPFLSCQSVYQEALWHEVKLNKRGTKLGSIKANKSYGPVEYIQGTYVNYLTIYVHVRGTLPT